MKRSQHKTSSKPRGQTRVIEPGRLAEARGAGGITIRISDPTPYEMTIQHNEALVRL